MGRLARHSKYFEPRKKKKPTSSSTKFFSQTQNSRKYSVRSSNWFEAPWTDTMSAYSHMVRPEVARHSRWKGQTTSTRTQGVSYRGHSTFWSRQLNKPRKKDGTTNWRHPTWKYIVKNFGIYALRLPKERNST